MITYQATPDFYRDYIAHYGIKGMRWGVRRYQDKNGNLTEKGRKHYSSMDPERLRKKLQKQVRKAKKKSSGWSNQWEDKRPIGEESRKAIEKRNNDREKYINSKEWKKYIKKLENAGDDWDKVKTPKKYDSFGTWTKIGPNGMEESRSYSKSYGKKITEGYLKDLGYSKKDSEYLAELLNKRNKNLH